MTNRRPKYVKYRVDHERIWVVVDRITTKYYIGRINNDPITRKVKFNQVVRVPKSEVLDYDF